MTSKNRPKVSSVSGRVSTISSGLTMALANPSSKAETTSAPVLAKLMPLKMWLATQSDKAVMVQWIRKGVICSSMRHAISPPARCYTTVSPARLAPVSKRARPSCLAR